MKKEMPKVMDCNATVCAYNQKNQCHAIAITVGGGECAMCDTGLITDKKGGIADITGGVGACKVDKCKYNSAFECNTSGIYVKLHSDHADCSTYQER